MYSTIKFSHTTEFDGNSFTVDINYIKSIPGRVQSVTATLNDYSTQEFNVACLDDLLSLLADPRLDEIKDYLDIKP
jgi:hypothetical protein